MTFKNATEAMMNIDKLEEDLQLKVDEIKKECKRVGDMWKGLGRIGGQRCDSAAEYLKCIELEFKDTMRWMDRVHKQLTEHIVYPWGDEGNQEMPTEAEIEAEEAKERDGHNKMGQNLSCFI